MKILALDQSLTATGIAVITFADFRETRFTDTWAPPKALRGGERLAWINGKLKAEITNGVDLLAVEDTPMHMVGAAKNGLAELLGVLKCTAFERGVRLLVINAMHVKMFAAGDAHADKDRVTRAAMKAWPGVIAEDTNGVDNEADALWLAEIARHMEHGLEGDTEKRRQVLAKMRGEPPAKKKPTRKPPKIEIEVTAKEPSCPT